MQCPRSIFLQGEWYKFKATHLKWTSAARHPTELPSAGSARPLSQHPCLALSPSPRSSIARSAFILASHAPEQVEQPARHPSRALPPSFPPPLPWAPRAHSPGTSVLLAKDNRPPPCSATPVLPPPSSVITPLSLLHHSYFYIIGCETKLCLLIPPSSPPHGFAPPRPHPSFCLPDCLWPFFLESTACPALAPHLSTQSALVKAPVTSMELEVTGSAHGPHLAPSLSCLGRADPSPSLKPFFAGPSNPPPALLPSPGHLLLSFPSCLSLYSLPPPTATQSWGLFSVPPPCGLTHCVNPTSLLSLSHLRSGWELSPELPAPLPG